MKLIQILFCSILLLSCSQNIDKKTDSSELVEQKNKEVEMLSFDEVIPEQLSDSSKLLIISGWINKINHDTCLTHKEYSDTSGFNIHAYYRNDSLVRITREGRPFLIFKSNLTFKESDEGISYFFYMDNLIGYTYECSSQPLRRSSCDPVNIFHKMYIYKDKMIHEEKLEAPYQSAGCPCFYLELDSSFKTDDFILNFMRLEIKRFKEIINTANRVDGSAILR